MKKKRVGKLVLHRETVRTLNSSTLRRAVGAVDTEAECTTFIFGTCGDPGSNNCSGVDCTSWEACTNGCATGGACTATCATNCVSCRPYC